MPPQSSDACHVRYQVDNIEGINLGIRIHENFRPDVALPTRIENSWIFEPQPQQYSPPVPTAMDAALNEDQQFMSNLDDSGFLPGPLEQNIDFNPTSLLSEISDPFYADWPFGLKI